jgi:hypothetical protein
MKIENLTKAQVEMLDFMWNELGPYEEMNDWLDTLDPADRRQAESLQELILLEAAETLVEQSKYREANKIINKFRS